MGLGKHRSQEKMKLKFCLFFKGHRTWSWTKSYHLSKSSRYHLFLNSHDVGSIVSFTPPSSPAAFLSTGFPDSLVGFGVGWDTEEGLKIKWMSFFIIMAFIISATACFHYSGQVTSSTNCSSFLEWEGERGWDSIFSLPSTRFSMLISLSKMIISVKYHSNPRWTKICIQSRFLECLSHARHYNEQSSFIILFYLFKNPVK